MEWVVMSVRCGRISARVTVLKCRSHFHLAPYLQDGSETCTGVCFGDSGTSKETGGLRFSSAVTRMDTIRNANI